MSEDGPGADGLATTSRASTPRGIILVSYWSFILVGWSGLFVPSLIRVLESDFGRSDAEFGLVYLVGALLSASGALSSGLIAGQIGRRVVNATAALLIAGGMALEAVAPSWPIFLAGAGLAGAGCGAIVALGSSVIMDLSASGSGSSLNRLHVFYSVGALAAPVAISLLIGLDIPWRLIALATGLAGLALAEPLSRAGAVQPRRRSPVTPATAEREAARLTGPELALAGLGLAIACYVAAESGVSSWLVGFLADEPMTAATLALSLFWIGMAAGRMVASRVADRFDPVRFTASCAWAGGIAVLAAVGLASGPVRISLFMAAGFAFGPVYPMIMTVAGSLFPHRSAAVAGIVASAGVVGVDYVPPADGPDRRLRGPRRRDARRGLPDYLEWRHGGHGGPIAAPDAAAREARFEPTLTAGASRAPRDGPGLREISSRRSGTRPVDSLDGRVADNRRQLGAQGLDGSLEKVDLVLVAGAPDRPEQLAMADHAVRVLDEVLQQPELRRRQVDLRAQSLHSMADRIDDQPSASDRRPVRIVHRMRFGQRGLDPRHEIGQAQGICGVFVCLKARVVRSSRLASQGGHEQDREVSGSPNCLQRMPAVQTRRPYVQQQDASPARLEYCQRVRVIAGRPGLPAVALQPQPQQRASSCSSSTTRTRRRPGCLSAGRSVSRETARPPGPSRRAATPKELASDRAYLSSWTIGTILRRLAGIQKPAPTYTEAGLSQIVVPEKGRLIVGPRRCRCQDEWPVLYVPVSAGPRARLPRPGRPPGPARCCRPRPGSAGLARACRSARRP